MTPLEALTDMLGAHPYVCHTVNGRRTYSPVTACYRTTFPDGETRLVLDLGLEIDRETMPPPGKCMIPECLNERVSGAQLCVPHWALQSDQEVDRANALAERDDMQRDRIMWNEDREHALRLQAYLEDEREER